MDRKPSKPQRKRYGRIQERDGDGDDKTINGRLPPELIAYIFQFLPRDLDPLLRGVCGLWRALVHQLPENGKRLPSEQATMLNVLCWAAREGRNDLFFNEDLWAAERKPLLRSPSLLGAATRQVAWVAASVKMFWNSTTKGVYSPQFAASIQQLKRVDHPYEMHPDIQKAAVLGGHYLILQHVFKAEPGVTTDLIRWGVEHLAPFHSVEWLLDQLDDTDIDHYNLGLLAAHYGHSKLFQLVVEKRHEHFPANGRNDPVSDWFKRAMLMCHHDVVLWCLRTKEVAYCIQWCWPVLTRADVLYLMTDQIDEAILGPTDLFLRPNGLLKHLDSDDDERSAGLHDTDLFELAVRRGGNVRSTKYRTWRCYVIAARLDALDSEGEASGAFPRMEELHEQGLPLHPQITVHVAGTGNIRALAWLAGHKCPFHQGTVLEAAIFGHLETVKWLIRRGCPWNEDETARLSRRQPHVLAWIRHHSSLCERAGYTFADPSSLIPKVVYLDPKGERPPTSAYRFNVQACSDPHVEPSDYWITKEPAT